MTAKTNLNLVFVNKKEPFLFGFSHFLRDLWLQREVLKSLVKKELKVKYKGSVMGVAWSFIQPLVQLFVYGIVLGIFLGLGSETPGFGMYLFLGLVLWSLFSEIVLSGTSSVRANAGLVKKVTFRREIIPMAVSIVALVNFLISCSVIVLGFALTGNWPQVERLPFAIPAILIIFIFGSGLAMLLSAFNVVARDTKFIVDLLMMLTMWMSSIFYAWHNVKYALESRGVPDWLVSIFLNNPITASIIAWRQAMWPQATEAAERASIEISAGVTNPHVYDLFDSWHSPVLMGTLLFSLGFFWFAQRVFNRLQANFASEL